MTTWKPKPLADLLGINEATLRKWVSDPEYAPFLSPQARGGKGARRSYDERDVRVLSWISQMRSTNTAHDEIIDTLRASQASEWEDLPPMPRGGASNAPIPVVPREAVEERVLALTQKYDTELKAVIAEKDRLQAELIQERNQNTELQKRVNELSTKEAELRGLLSQYEIGGKRITAITLVGIALAVGIGLAIVMLVLVLIVP